MVKIKIFDPRFGGRNVTLNRDGQSARDIYKYYIEEENRPADQILPRNAQWDKKKKKIKFFKSKLWGPAPSPYAQVFHYQNIITDPVHNLYSVIESYRGKTIELTMVDFNGVKHNDTITIPQTGFRKNVWDGLYWWLGLYPAQGYWDPNNNEQFNPDTQTQLVISIKDKVNPVQIHQAFLDGTTHCLLTPICDWVDERLKNLEPGSRRTKFITKYNWLHDSRKLRGGFLGKYKDGVPDNPEDLQLVCDKIGINLEINIPSYLVNESCVIHKYRAKLQDDTKTFKFLNIRLNHIELNELMNTGDIITLKPEELFKLKKEFDEKDTYYGWYDNNNIIHKLVTLSHTYQSSSDYKDVMDEFGEENNLDRYYIHHLEHQKLSDFILENQNTNHAINFLNPGPDVEDKIIEKTWNVEKGRWDEDFNDEINKNSGAKERMNARNKIIEKLKVKVKLIDIENNGYDHIDGEKAYCRAKSSPYYEGFLGKIINFKKTDQIEGIGCYQITNINYSDHKNCPLLKKMNFIHDKNVYASPLLKQVRDNGVEFDIVGGCWGTSFDMDMYDQRLFRQDSVCRIDSEPILSDYYSNNGGEIEIKDYYKNPNPKHYKKFYGSCMVNSQYDCMKFRCKDLEFAQLVRYHNAESDIRYNPEDNFAMIQTEKKVMRHQGQISLFISAYSLMNLLDQLFKFKNIDDIYRICVDGIFFKKDVKVELTSLYKKKEGKLSMNNETHYIDNGYNEIYEYCREKEIIPPIELIEKNEEKFERMKKPERMKKLNKEIEKLKEQFSKI